VMANLVLLIPLMLATPARTWRERVGKLALALLVALVLQVVDVIVGIKVFYATSFHERWGAFATQLYQFLDAFFQSWDTQLFPFAIWAGVNFRVILPERLFAQPTPAQTPRAERRRREAKRR
jgi:hypothetical protein